ncbi:cytochrome P450, putative [Ixodes scapularis]|uniref:Cytochrome P450, putative n=1 Tax=Ixodes scapularis TaxID=6945 RepID=B7PBS9_IXOSC|nr:cytochrome P450, putative [Ixodes scapularis]|eukprot:XP_002408833.1 cytochrome P450, putative [Ixodes scapularis]
MLGLHPKTQAKVHRELDAIFGTDTNRCVTSDDLKRMKYLECCLKETMRLYPPVPIVGRVLEHDQVIDNQTVPKGVQFFINVFRLHRNPKYFSDPERYLPERFMREETTFRPPFVYIPFSRGARKCLGQAFAMMEIKLLLAKIFSKFKVEIIRPLDHPKINIDEIISAREELRVWIRRREAQE